MEIYFLDSVDVVVKYSQNSLFLTLWAPALTKNVLSIFFSRSILVNDSRNKKMAVYLLCVIAFEIINFYIFFIKMSCFGSNLFFYKWRITNNYKKRRHAFVQQCFLKLCTKFQGKRESRSGTGVVMVSDVSVSNGGIK